MKTTRSLLATLAATLLVAPVLHAQTATQLWATRYNGPANGDDYAIATAVDGAGNVVVTGQSYNGANNDYYTAKYAAADGALLWEVRYNGPGNGDDVAFSVAVDSAGNAVATGASSNGSNIDYYTAKYRAADGALLWEKRYTGTATGVDRARNVAVDGADNVIVTGESAGTGGSLDYYTAKYSAANGTLLWEKRYNGPANDTDSGRCVAVDSAGNVAVTGYSSSLKSGFYRPDYYTAKYAAANGALLWERRYASIYNRSDAASRVAVDSAGNVAVTGYSEIAFPSQAYYTAKYAAADGALLWEKRYSGPGNNGDAAYSVAMDATGNVVVTGVSYSSGPNPDFYTAKYAAANGALLWEKRNNGPGGSSGSGSSVALDADGNVVVMGQSFNGNDTDFYTAKYAATDGALLWEARYNSPGNGAERVNNPFPLAGKLALTADGGAVITGQSTNASGNYDYATVRYAPPSLLTPFQQWKIVHLGGTSAHNDGDPDFDGLRNILEYATGSDPLVPGALPAVSTVANTTALTFSRNTAATDVTLTVQGSDDLSAWTDLARSTGGGAMVALVAGVVVNESGAGALRTVEVRDLYAIGDPAHPQRFLRLQAAPTAAAPAAPLVPRPTVRRAHPRRR